MCLVHLYFSYFLGGDREVFSKPRKFSPKKKKKKESVQLKVMEIGEMVKEISSNY